MTFRRSAAPFTSSQVTSLGRCPVVAARTTAFLGGGGVGSVLVDLALDLISDLLEGFGGVVSDPALDISSELVICQVLQELVSQKLVLICDCCCIQALHPC